MSKRILFTGDSITDAGRTISLQGVEHMPHPAGANIPAEFRERMINRTLGDGYPCLVNARLACDLPGKYEVLNRGISGHRISDLYARVKRDCINLAPDVISLMIGINGVWHECIDHNGVDNEHFEWFYDMMLGDIKAALPETKLILLEPYVFEGFSTKANWAYFRDETALRREVVARMAKKYGTSLIATQSLIEDACARTGTAFDAWAGDGVHPTPAGHQLIADAWLKVFETLSV